MGQNPTLPLRVSEALHNGLENIRDFISPYKGAEQRRKAAEEEHLEEERLDRDPPESLRAMRQKLIEKRSLSKAEWKLLTHGVQYRMDLARGKPLPPETLLGVLKAFLDLYKQRTGSLDRYGYYFNNLSLVGYQGNDAKSVETVREAVAEAIQRVLDPAQNYIPYFAARNLFVLLEYEQFTSLEAINEALVPYWRVLWREAALGQSMAPEDDGEL
jgi:hypothetical protein